MIGLWNSKNYQNLMTKKIFKSLDFIDDKLVFIDQTKLPLIEEYVETDDYLRIAEAIERLEIRGAPAIGVAAAYALALAVKKCVSEINTVFDNAYKRLAATRPTAVNLFWALNEIKKTYLQNISEKDLYSVLIRRAKEIHLDDILKCKYIAENGLIIFKKKSVVLTHCNAGQLATGGDGTALNVIKEGFRKGLVEFVYADETRPLFQGSRLTAFELDKEGIPFSINTDSTAAVILQQKKVDLVITGADRIAANGDAANKIGTYNLAVLCAYHGIPFYIAAPTSTIDKNCSTGNDIKIELRDKEEVIRFRNEYITCPEYETYSPAFDVTPSNLITGIITEEKFFTPPYSF